MNIFSKWLFSKPKELCEQESKDIYQIKEYDGEIWLTYNGALICPMALFSEKPIEVLSKIRESYVKRNTTEQP